MSDPCIRLLESSDDISQFLTWLREVLDSGVPIGFDTETRSATTLWHPTARPFVRLAQFGTADGNGWAIPAARWGGVLDEAIRLVNQATSTVVGANVGYDQHALEVDGYPQLRWSLLEDVIVADRLVFPAERSHALKVAASRLLGSWAAQGQKDLDAAMAAGGWTWDTVPVDLPEYWTYGTLDTIITVLAWEQLEPQVPSWYEVEMEYIRLMHAVESRGILIDPDAVHVLDDSLGQEQSRLEGELSDAGLKNPGSSLQVKQLFYDLDHEPFAFSEDTGEPSYSKLVLSDMAALPDPIGSAAALLMEWRRVFTWRNNYGLKLLRYPTAPLLHPSINTMQARTGRTSITDPPLQTIPKTTITRDIFVPRPGWELWSVDYDSQEVRIQAGLSGDAAMMDFFHQGGGDYHQYVADMAGIPRSVAKTLNFALSYGAGVAKLAQTAKCDEDTMRGYVDRLNAAFPDFAAWRADVVVDAQESATNGRPQVELPYGRVAALDAGKEYTQAGNTFAQGHGADVLKLAAYRVDEAGYGDNIVLPVHDELVMQFPKGSGEQAAAEVAELLRDECLSLPLTASADGPFSRWGDKHRPQET